MRTMDVRPRRKVNWAVISGGEPGRARLVSPSGQSGGFARIASALALEPSFETVDRVLRQTVEFARSVIGLERAAIFLLAPNGKSMVGTWGTDMQGRTSDEHDLLFDVDDMVRQFFARSAQGHAWSIYEDCPLVSHEGNQSRSLGRGWLGCTAIQAGGRPIGILFNDTAMSRAPFDDAVQARVALLCSLLGRGLDMCRDHLFNLGPTESKPRHPLVRQAAQLLVRDPSLSFQELADQLRVTKAHLTRTFKRHAASSIVDYRNELRLAEFLGQVNRKGLLDAALGAGFGSYAQFHRVFRARFGKGPREYLLEQQVERAPAGGRHGNA
jgi:AraC-like DNA-binding protein